MNETFNQDIEHRTHIRNVTGYFFMGGLCILVLCLFLFSGCARITYKNDELSYTRLGKQKIEGFTMKKDSQGNIQVKFSKQEGSTGDLSKAILNATEIMKKGAGVP